MRQHRDELGDSGTEEGLTSGSDDSSPRLSELEAAPDDKQPFGRASDTDAPHAGRLESATSSGGDGSVAAESPDTEPATSRSLVSESADPPPETRGEAHQERISSSGDSDEDPQAAAEHAEGGLGAKRIRLSDCGERLLGEPPDVCCCSQDSSR